ncbi:TIGR01841 family phasin [Caballeronia grimmiae]|uniref:TIGR01841 family phasin n=1 Tax=Caballeronia grimmiae TaxID=1071679 RepID=UPI0038B7BD6B
MMDLLLQCSKDELGFRGGLARAFMERAMFPSFQSSAPEAAAQLEAFFGITKRYAMGLQQITDLNVQTVKAVLKESASVLASGSDARPGDFMGSQWMLLAEVPEKSAAYARHFFRIVRETEADILEEARSQYEQYGSE